MTNLRRVLGDEEDEDEHRVEHHQLQAEWAEQRGQPCTSEPLTPTELPTVHDKKTKSDERLYGSCAQLLMPLLQSDR